MSPADLIAFEQRVREAFERGEVRGPVHLSGGNEAQLIEIFSDIKREDWVFSTWRSHYHALLHGVDPEFLYAEICAGRSLSFNSAEHRFYTSALVAGCLPIAVGVAAGLKRRGRSGRVWCFCGDMAALTGAFTECTRYAINFALPITFIVEDNGLSTETPTGEAWGRLSNPQRDFIRIYRYTRTVPHYGSGGPMQ